MKLSYQHTVWACNLASFPKPWSTIWRRCLFVVVQRAVWIDRRAIGPPDFDEFRHANCGGYPGHPLCGPHRPAHLRSCRAPVLRLRANFDGRVALCAPQSLPRAVRGGRAVRHGGGIIEVMVSPIVEALPGEHKEKAMSMVHSFYCWGQAAVVLISTLLLWRFSQGMWRLLPIGWALIPAGQFRGVRARAIDAGHAGKRTHQDRHAAQVQSVFLSRY